MPYLIGLTGPYTGQAFEVKEGRLTIGRGPGCNVVLAADAAVSRAHAVLVTAGGVVQVQDAGSTHGVWVNGKRVTQSLLRSGDCVQVGATCFQVSPVPAQLGEPPRLKVVLPQAGAFGAPGVGVMSEPPISLPLGCFYYIVALLMPIPFGFWIARAYLKKSHPSNRQFATICLVISILSLVVQLWMSLVLVRRVMKMMGPMLGPGGDLGF